MLIVVFNDDVPRRTFCRFRHKGSVDVIELEAFERNLRCQFPEEGVAVPCR